VNDTPERDWVSYQSCRISAGGFREVAGARHVPFVLSGVNVRTISAEHEQPHRESARPQVNDCGQSQNSPEVGSRQWICTVTARTRDPRLRNRLKETASDRGSYMQSTCVDARTSPNATMTHPEAIKPQHDPLVILRMSS
jgi:hypothetical protein